MFMFIHVHLCEMWIFVHFEHNKIYFIIIIPYALAVHVYTFVFALFGTFYYYYMYHLCHYCYIGNALAKLSFRFWVEIWSNG